MTTIVFGRACALLAWAVDRVGAGVPTHPVYTTDLIAPIGSVRKPRHSCSRGRHSLKGKKQHTAPALVTNADCVDDARVRERERPRFPTEGRERTREEEEHALALCSSALANTACATAWMSAWRPNHPWAHDAVISAHPGVSRAIRRSQRCGRGVRAAQCRMQHAARAAMWKVCLRPRGTCSRETREKEGVGSAPMVDLFV